MIGIVRSSVKYGSVFAGFLVAACGGRSGTPSDTASSGGTLAEGASRQVMVRGPVDGASATELSITSDSGSVIVKLTQPVTIYDREAGTLADVKNNSFVGITSVKQPDGSERATEIHVFPEDLRGLGEGSRMMSRTAGAGSGSSGGASGNRMTNGAVSSSPAGSGAGASRMSNGNVASSNGSTLVVQYAGGSQTITVPPNTKVTIIKATSHQLARGDSVVAIAQRAADGSLSTQKVLLTRK